MIDDINSDLIKVIFVFFSLLASTTLIGALLRLKKTSRLSFALFTIATACILACDSMFAFYYFETKFGNVYILFMHLLYFLALDCFYLGCLLHQEWEDEMIELLTRE